MDKIDAISRMNGMYSKVLYRKDKQRGLGGRENIQMDRKMQNWQKSKSKTFSPPSFALSISYTLLIQ